MTEIVNIITNVGFPIVVALICFWHINRQSETHKMEVTQLTEAINNNTVVMQQLIDKLE